MPHPAAPRGPFAALAQRVGQTLDDGAVDVGPGVNVAKTDHGALRFRPRDLDPRRPVGLEDEPHRARRHRLHQFVEEVFGLDPAFFGNPSLAQTELLFEPRDHPITTIDLHLEAVGARYRRRKRRQHGHRFDIAPVGGVDGGAGAVAQARYPGIETARTEHLAGLVGGRGDQRQPRRDTGSRRGGRCDLAQHLTRRHQVGQLLAGHRAGPATSSRAAGPTGTFCNRRAHNPPGSRSNPRIDPPGDGSENRRGTDTCGCAPRSRADGPATSWRRPPPGNGQPSRASEPPGRPDPRHHPPARAPHTGAGRAKEWPDAADRRLHRR